MRRRDKVLVAAIVAFALVAAMEEASFRLLPAPARVLVPAGTVIGAPGLNVTFTVFGSSGRLTGAGYSDRGGEVRACKVGESCIFFLPRCAGSPVPWHALLNFSLVPGTYVMHLAPGANGSLHVTDPVQLTYPGDVGPTDGFIAFSCGA